MKRANRRRRDERAKRHAYRIEKSWRCVCGRVEEPTPRQVGKRAAAPAFCSGHCCGNARRYEKGKWALTTQEQRADERDRRR